MELSLIGKREASEDLDTIGIKRIKIEESFELKNLPSAACYEKSYMHKEPVTHILASTKFDFIFTASQDGYVKFWRKSV